MKREETKTKRALEKLVERRKREEEEKKQLKDALAALRAEVRKHESVVYNLEKKHAEELRTVEIRAEGFEAEAVFMKGILDETIRWLALIDTQ